jgi:hypothetical protein
LVSGAEKKECDVKAKKWERSNCMVIIKSTISIGIRGQMIPKMLSGGAV